MIGKATRAHPNHPSPSPHSVYTQTLDKGKHSENAILDASNRFYTVIPHDFGMKKPPLIKDNDIISVCQLPPPSLSLVQWFSSCVQIIRNNFTY